MNTSPKVLLFDIETAPILGWVWGLFKQTIGINQIKRDWYMLCYAAKWLEDSYTMYDAIWIHPKYYKEAPESDYQIVKSMWDLLDEADIVVAHNADRFDVAKVNAKFFEYGLLPPSPYKVVDTLKVSRSNFGHSSHRLDHIARLRKLDPKLKTDFDLWIDVMDGDKVAQENMCEYNIHDVELLEEAYLDMRPWITNHPNYGVYTDDETTICPTCGSENIHYRGYAYTTAGKFQRFVCRDCGHWSRLAANLLPLDKRKGLARNVAK